MIDMQEAQQKGLNIVDSTKQHNPLKSMLEQNFPDTLSEGEVNLKALAMLLGLDPHSNTQGYELTFTGKGLANTLYTTPTEFELSEEVERGKDRESTGNSIIIGDNLDVLKILKSAYYEKIKMIYIDPPYNTKSENFIYPDDFRKDYRKILHEVGLLSLDEEGNEIESKALQTFRNITGSRSHSGWLSFMLPRLKLARDLLKEDGVIFISIDDNEQANLKILCDEIFGEENFVAQIIWQKKKGGGGSDSEYFQKEHEYILCYKKDTWSIYNLIGFHDQNNFKNTINGKKANIRKLEKDGDNALRQDRPTLYYAIKDPLGNDFYPIAPNGKDGRWRKKPESLDAEHIYWQESKGRLTPYEVTYFDEIKNKIKLLKTRTILTDYGTTTEGTNEIQSFFIDKIFDTPKPTTLIKLLARLSSSQDDIILDFFAGSGTTAQAVMELNAEDGGNRQFILVQLPEEIKEDRNKTTYDFVKNELGRNEPKISDITIERVKRAGERLKSEGLVASSVDIGYRVYSLGEKARLSDEGSIIPHSANITPTDIARNLALFAGKPLHIPLEEIVADKLFVCEDILCVVGIDKEVEEKILEDKNRAIFIDGYGTYTLESFLNLNIPNDERVSVVY